MIEHKLYILEFPNYLNLMHSVNNFLNLNIVVNPRVINVFTYQTSIEFIWVATIQYEVHTLDINLYE